MLAKRVDWPIFFGWNVSLGFTEPGSATKKGQSDTTFSAESYMAWNRLHVTPTLWQNLELGMKMFVLPAIAWMEKWVNYTLYTPWYSIFLPYLVFHLWSVRESANAVPANKNCALKLPTFGAIVGVNPTEVQWKDLTLEEPPSWSWLTSAPGKYAWPQPL